MHKQKQITHLIAFNKSCTKSREILGDLQLLKHKDNFYVAKDGVAHLVKKYVVDNILKNLGEQQLKTYFQNNGYIQIAQLSNNDYVLKAKGNILVGGAGGTTMVAGPVAGYATFHALEVTLAPAIEAASIYGAFAGGMMGGVATGPV